MDPKLLKLLGITVQAPVDDLGGEGGGGRVDSEDPEDPENPEDPEDTDDDDDDDPEDPEDPEDDEEGDDGDDDDDSDDDDEELGARAQKRINKLIAQRKDAEARVKTLEQQLADAKKLSGDDGKAIMKAAEASGILPGLMTKDEAEAFTEMDRYRKVIASYEQWLDNHDPDDELEIDNGKTMSYAKVERRVRKLQGELGDLKDEYGPRRKELLKKVREIFEAGVEALKTGKKKPVEKKPKKTERKDDSTKQKPKANSPKPKRGTGKDIEDMDVENDDDLENYITAMRRKK